MVVLRRGIAKRQAEDTICVLQQLVWRGCRLRCPLKSEGYRYSLARSLAQPLVFRPHAIHTRSGTAKPRALRTKPHQSPHTLQYVVGAGVLATLTTQEMHTVSHAVRHTARRHCVPDMLSSPPDHWAVRRLGQPCWRQAARGED